MDSELNDALLTVGDLIRWGASRLNAAGRHFGHGTDNAADEARVLVFHALALDFDSPEYFYDCRITDPERAAAVALLTERVESAQPAAYLTGEAWFAGLRFQVTTDVLIPRSPLAELIANGFEPWITLSPESRVLDLGTGSGCIAIAIAAHFGCSVDATDISAPALMLARQNVAAHELDERVNVIKSDVFAQLAQRRYDLIVSNPPYVPTESMASLPDEYAYEPEIGLRAGDDGLEIVNRILEDAAAHLNPGGVLICEVGESAATVASRYAHLPLEWIHFHHGGDGVFAIRAEQLTKGDIHVG